MRGKVLSVIDGDTFNMDFHGLPIRCRIANIDAPEKSKAFGKEAKQYLEKLILEKEITFEFIEKDNYNRMVIIPMTPENEPIDEILVQNGIVWHWTKYSHKPKLEDMENQARIKKIGLWQDNIVQLHLSERCRKVAQSTSINMK